MGQLKVSDEEFEKHIKESKNIREALIAMGYKGKGGNYISLQQRALKLNIDISHLIVNNISNVGQYPCSNFWILNC